MTTAHAALERITLERVGLRAGLLSPAAFFLRRERGTVTESRLSVPSDPSRPGWPLAPSDLRGGVSLLHPPLQKGKVRASNPSISLCPQQLRMFDLNGDGKLGLSEMSR